MSLKNVILSLWATCLCCKVIISGCEVVWVNRNVTDSFRVGQDGCTNDTNVCTNVSATCRNDGSCLCNSTELSFQNPVINETDSDFVYGDSYGCTNNMLIRYEVGNASTYCDFSPFQVIPYCQVEETTNFRFEGNDTLKRCVLQNVSVKFPNTSTAMTLPWLNESYMHLNVSNNTLYFKWKRSVPNLQGSIITINLNCTNSSEYLKRKKCVRAKILGTWFADDRAANNQSNASTFTPVIQFTPTMAASPTTSASFNPGDQSSDDDDFSTTTIIIIAVAGGVAVLIVIILVCCLGKHRRRRRQRHSTDEGPREKNEIPSMKRLRHTESNMRGPLAYADVPSKDSTMTFGAQANSADPTPENQETIVPDKPSYENKDSQNIEKNEVNFYSDPDYESDDSKINESNKGKGTFRAEPEYETVDQRKDVVDDINSYPEIGYENPDYIKKGDNRDSHPTDKSSATVNKKKKKEKPVSSEYDYATVDIQQKESDKANSYPEIGYETPDLKKKVDGRKSHPVDNSYATVDKKKKKVKPVPSEYDYATVEPKKADEANSNPVLGYKKSDAKNKDIDSGNSFQDTTYESIDETNERDRKSKKINATTIYTPPDFGNEAVNEAKSDDIYSTPYSDVSNAQEDLQQSLPKIKHIQVNGDTYALPNK